jgi:methyl acetate hydrolase
MLEGFDGDTPRLRPAATAATVGPLVTHTAGLSYWFWNADIVRWQEITGTPHVMSGLNVIFTAPLIDDPGTRFEYGINIDWLGRVIEAAAGTTLDDAIRTASPSPSAWRRLAI